MIELEKEDKGGAFTGKTLSLGRSGEEKRLIQDTTALLIALEKGRVKQIVAENLDVLVQLVKRREDLLLMLDFFKEHNIAFVSRDGTHRSVTNSPDFLLAILKKFFDAERQRHGHNVKEGMSEARSRGEHVGRPSKGPNAAVSRLRKQGHSIREIAKKLRISVATVHRDLKRADDI